MWRCEAGTRGWRGAPAPGVLATLAFYTRLNNLPMALAVARSRCRFASRFGRRPAPNMGHANIVADRGTVVSALCLGLVLFAWRTWHYTGVFSVFYGTQRDRYRCGSRGWRSGL